MFGLLRYSVFDNNYEYCVLISLFKNGISLYFGTSADNHNNNSWYVTGSESQPNVFIAELYLQLCPTVT